jgi:hypothetical protein
LPVELPVGLPVELQWRLLPGEARNIDEIHPIRVRLGLKMSDRGREELWEKLP